MSEKVLTAKDIEDILDILGDRLQEVGFDNNYEITKEGVRLETLIDKFTGMRDESSLNEQG